MHQWTRSTIEVNFITQQILVFRMPVIEWMLSLNQGKE
jgi:hypothetical protein